jgi:hypothetical protein
MNALLMELQQQLPLEMGGTQFLDLGTSGQTSFFSCLFCQHNCAAYPVSVPDADLQIFCSVSPDPSPGYLSRSFQNLKVKADKIYSNNL